MVRRRLVSRINFARIVAAQPQPPQRLIWQRFHKLQQPRIAAKEMLAHVRARRNHELLVFAVYQLAHALDEQTLGVTLKYRVPLAAPEHFDDVPACAPKRRLQLLNDLAVAAHRSIKALQVAIHDKNQIVQLLTRSQRDRAKRLGFVRFAVAEERPNFRVRAGLQAAIFQIPVVARLINGHQRAEAHGHRRKFPEIRHQPRMRIRRQPAAGFQFAPEVFQLVRADAPFDKRARINSRRSVALKINRVALEFFGAPAEKMVKTDFVQRRCRGISRNMSADVVLNAVRAHHHGQRVPANQALDAALEFLVSRKQRLQARRNAVGIRRVRAKRQVNSAHRGVRAQPFEDFRGHFRPAGFQHGIQRLQPLLNLNVFDRMLGTNRCLIRHFGLLSSELWLYRCHAFPPANCAMFSVY